jgi:co-chaperonin GroES (HSP10)
MQNENKLLEKTQVKKKRNLNIEPHPNQIILMQVDESMTPGGIYLPTDAQPMTPVAEVIAKGSNVSDWVNKGDIFYLVPQYMAFAEIERQKVITTFEDGLIAKVTRKGKEL